MRRINGLSQVYLGKQLNISRSKIASYESGIVEPNALTFIIISEYFGIDSREFLEDNLSENPIENIVLDAVSSNFQSEFVKEQLDDFIRQTNEMTKILEGYISFLELQQDQPNYDANRAIYSSLEDLLTILQMLIDSNWKLIRAILPTPIGEE